MPIVQVEIVAQNRDSLVPELARQLADQLAALWETPPGATWVKVGTLDPENYAENGGGPPAGVLPIFVTVLRARWPDGPALRCEIRQVTEIVATCCRRPAENVHVLYLPPAGGRMAFGGVLVEK